ncbi:MAG TPA: DUF2066 domain-containing protein [Steroidobacteraceae bacterium]|jgi:hypothetical protein|nr:DUF2066 domain-containing protein [Steroidobacteraceae bacterium]
MARDYRGICARYLRPLALLCLSIVGLCLADASAALTRAELYQAKVPVTDRSEASKPAAFEAALAVVLTRVTGRRTADADPVFGPLLGNARRYVQQYRDTQDGQLWVSFDAAAIDRWLAQNNQPLWGRERPSTYVWLTVPGGPQAGTVITAEDTSDLKAAVDAAAYQRGAPVMWPSAADLQRNHLDYAAVGSASGGTLADIGHRAGGTGTLIGHANAAGAAAGVRWTFLFQDRSSEFSGAAAEGINRAADTYAGLFAVSGAAAPVVIEIVGVNDLKDYAFVQSYLESLAFISHVGVDALNGNMVRFRLTTRGGAEALQNALPLSGRLQSGSAGENGIQRFELRH